MKSWRAISVLMVVMMLGGWGCADDLYAVCNLDPQSPDATQRQCAQSSDSASCAIDNFLQCDTRVCARYNGSDAFCTQACTDDAECGDGACRDFNPLQPNVQRYCVPTAEL